MNKYEKRILTVQEQWDELAQSSTLGFANEQEMFRCLAMDWNDKAIADLLGYNIKTIRRRRSRYGIEPAYLSQGGWSKKRRLLNERET